MWMMPASCGHLWIDGTDKDLPVHNLDAAEANTLPGFGNLAIKDSRCVRVDMMCVLLFRLTYAPTEIVKARVAHALPTHHALSFSEGAGPKIAARSGRSS